MSEEFVPLMIVGYILIGWGAFLLGYHFREKLRPLVRALWRGMVLHGERRWFRR